MSNLTVEQIRQGVRENYTKVSQRNTGCCGSSSSCCGAGASSGSENQSTRRAISTRLGYSEHELDQAPAEANLGLGCGNPQVLAALQTGESVLDLGSGAGLDAFLAARAVGPEGKVIGVDMTPAMIDRARANQQKNAIENVDFRLGEIENLPVADTSIDVIISNCVINLSPEKERVFAEAYRVLKPGGRLAIADTVSTADLPADARNDLNMIAGCVSGASSIQELTEILEKLGFDSIEIQASDSSREFIKEWVPGSNIQDYIFSASIEAIKPV